MEIQAGEPFWSRITVLHAAVSRARSSLPFGGSNPSSRARHLETSSYSVFVSSDREITNLRLCQKHGEKTRHYFIKSSWKCALCVKSRVVRKRKTNKQALVTKFGGACQICGYCRTNRALEFHHRDETTKMFGLGTKGSLALATLMKEAEKCVLLCSNCHREVHEGLVEAPKPLIVSLVESDKSSVSRKCCLDCQKQVTRQSVRCKRCAQLALKRARINWDTPENLLKRLETESFLKVAKTIGVSDNAIRKFLITRGFEPPSRKKKKILATEHG